MTMAAFDEPLKDIRLRTVLGRLEMIIDNENERIGTDMKFDIKASNVHKSRCLYELTVLCRDVGPGDFPQGFAAQMKGMKQKLQVNARKLEAHMNAMRTVADILRCLQVRSSDDYTALAEAFDAENAARDAHPVELEPADPFPARVHIHDPRSQLIVRISDDSGEALAGAGFLLTAGPQASPDRMPPGFMLDRQVNAHHRATATLYLDHTLLAGADRVSHPDHSRKTLRPATPSHRPYGASVTPQDLGGLVHHALARSIASDDLFAILGPHQTTVLDVVLSRKIHAGVFRLTRDLEPQDFRKPAPGPVIG